MPRTPQAYRALDAYRDAARADRLRAKLGWVVGSAAELEKQVPLAARVLEVGCGYGQISLYLAVCSADRDVVGVDADTTRIGIARGAVTHLGEGVGTVDLQQRAVDSGDALPAGPFDVVILHGEAPDLAEACRDRLAPGGRVLVARRCGWRRAPLG